MRTGGVPIAALLLVLAFTVLQVTEAGDIYWEGEEDASNEFLEVKDDDPGMIDHLKRLKRQSFFFNPFNILSPSKNDTEDSAAEGDDTYDRDDRDFGSGYIDRSETEPSEKTLRVTFPVFEPYRTAYSNRDSPEFLEFSQSLASAVDKLYEGLPGTQKSSLVRIQSLITDEFSCKVTLDIVTTGYDDTDTIKDLLRNYIQKYRRLGKTTVNAVNGDFSAQLIDPGTTLDCDDNEFKCDEYRCIPLTDRCNGYSDCNDNTDEQDCPATNYDDQKPDNTVNSIDNEPRRGDGGRVDDNADTLYAPSEETPVTEENYYSPEESPVTEENYYSPQESPVTEQSYYSPEESTVTQPSYYSPEESPVTEQNYYSPEESPVTEQSYYSPEESPVTEQNYYPSASVAPDQREVDITPRVLPTPEYTETTRAPDVCPADHMRCDETRCVENSRRCDGRVDCYDEADEAGCPDVTCGADDFRCDNGKCIEASRQCDRVADCPGQEDERDCDCRPDEFRCEIDGYCIEERKRCDGVPHCLDGSDERDCVSALGSWIGHHACRDTGRFRCSDGTCISILLRCDGFRDCKKDGSDEAGCPCGPGLWQCDHGSCIKRKFRCDGRVDCPTDRSDERNCIANGSFKCRTGTVIPEYLRCNRQYDCPPGDYSDEQNCPCGASDFKCDNGHCIPASKHCDRTHDCQDGSDERHCTYGTVCMAYEYKCKSGMCIPAEGRCNGTVECNDGTDEKDCTCKRDQYPCRDGSCINLAFRCNGHNDCSNGEDEYNCKSSCPPGQFTCLGGLACAVRCNQIPECDGGEDEEDCGACEHLCEANGKCIAASQICDHQRDCPDGFDEDSCVYCDRPGDFRCDNGECITFALKCNGIGECSDNSDEKNCNRTMTTDNSPCGDDQFECLSNHECINIHFYCDQREDCVDGSDEANCPCPKDSWQCRDGQCISSAGYCDNIPDCVDGTDESDCSWTTERTYLLPTTNRIPTTTSAYFYPQTERFPSYSSNKGACSADQWRCENGPCIESYRRCNGHVDCPLDYSDEFDCPPNSPIALNLKTYPSQQSVRHDGDVVFQCRDEGPQRARVKWHRDGGRPIKEGSTDVRGRLEMFKVTEADSGVYICQAEDYARYPESSVTVTLQVENPPVTFRPPFPACQPYEATCGNGQCIPKTAVCNGRVDCNDGSDEESCHSKGMCEPNQFKCNNRKCVLKTWICDSEDDCGDGSDEENCGAREEGRCSPVEFACKSGDQCIPKSFHCDGQTDCFDGTDEIGCIPVHVTSPPKPSNVKLSPGDTLTLRCEAVGVPVPLISWRLNWGHVPAKCSWTSDNGIGVLTCPNMQPDDSGAYSCEAINNKGTTFAAPDAIVFVSKSDLCPRGYFNNEARSESECIRCFCFGKSTQCRSADLFTYNMPTPLGEGGTRLIGIMSTPSGDVNIDTQSISSQYYYQALRNGATVTKFGNVVSWSNSHPYLTLPETYNGNQLKSYGGHIKYTLSPQTQIYGFDDTAATIIIKGKYGNLFHLNRAGGTRDINVEARLTPEGWSKYPDGSTPASREDIMMVLDDIEMILLRADLNNAGVNITDFAMESAEHINVGLGTASLVEECTCPKGYEGLSCQKCTSGFLRKKVGPWLGDCEPEECPAGTYGDPSSGVPCKPCPCPLTNRENQFARTCSLGHDGSVICDCFPGYEGQHCEVCAPGYEGNPLVAGDSCQPKKSDNCNPTGTKSIRPVDECVCKDNVQGRYCDQCKNDSFFLSGDFRHGCALCFCSGVSQQCVSSSFRRKAISVQFNVPQIVDQVKIYNSAPAGLVGSVRYSAPKETELRPQLQRGELILNNIERSSSRNNVYYWSMPISFAGDKVTSYGGYLRYTLKNVPTSVDPRYRNTAADVQLISDNQLTFHYFGDYSASHDGILNASVQFLEKGWQRQDGQEVSREHFLLALADVKTILIKATYSPGPQLASPVSASIDIAEPDAYGPTAFHVEKCVCPRGYIGTSCEDCAPGFTRSSSGLYLQHCEPCDCNNKSSMCNPETGVCYDCSDNTDGDRCDVCKPGYDRDPYGNCVEYRSSTRQPCNCDPEGSTGPCDESGNCNCKRNVEGDSCDRCRPGTFGLDSHNPDGCLSCFCSGVTTDCHEGNHYTRVPIAAPVLGDNYGGYTITDLKAEQVIKDNFNPLSEQSELMYNLQFGTNVELYWSLPIFPGNRVLSYGGSLSLRQKFSSVNDLQSERGTDVVLDGGDITIYWINPNQYQSGQSYSYQVPLKEEGWYRLNTVTQATRSDFMYVLRNLKRVLVRATVAQDIYETTIADVSMDTATPSYDSVLPVAKGIEICMCPPGYTGTSCESCSPGFYKDQLGYCRECSCNGHECQLDNTGQVVCNCLPPYTGYDCSTIGLVMELHPTIHDAADDDKLTRRVTFMCKYRAPEPLTIKFYHEGHEQQPPKYFYESKLEKDGWHGEHVWHTVWDTRRQGEIYECHTFTERGFTLGVLTTSLPEPGGDSSVTDRPTRPPPSEPTVSVTIVSPTIKIQEIGSSVNFTCQAQSRNTRSRLLVRWTKSDGHLPLERTYIDQYSGVLQITNLQVSDSGKYICETSDGINTAQAIATLKVPGNEMTHPSVEISPSVNEYYEGDLIELECRVKGNPTPSISWQRTSNRPLPLSAENRGYLLIIENAHVEDTGEYRCIASNTVGSEDRTAMITVRHRPPSPVRDKLVVSNASPTVDQGKSIRIVCTGSTNVPAGSIDWFRQDNAMFLANVRSENGVLYVDYAEPDNQGVYICHSPLSNVEPISVLLTVVAANPEPETYNITVSVDRLKIPTGGSGTVDCNPVGRPLPLIKWSKHGGSFGGDSSQRGNTLIINNAQETDQGYYLCEGTVNGNPVANIYVFVEIERREPPKVEIWPEGEQAVPLGGQHELHCRVLGGIPEPDVTWNRNGGRALSPSTQIQPHNVLKFNKIEVNDEGEYTCTARNDAGTVSASAVVKVRSLPEITITPQTYIQVNRGDPLKVECRANGYPQPMVSISLGDNPLVPPQPGHATLYVPSVSARDDGYYTCTANSVAGTITDQFLVIVDRGDGGDREGEFDDTGSGEDPDLGEPRPDWDDYNNNAPSNLYAIEGQPQTIIECNESGNVKWDRADHLPLQRNAYQSQTQLIILNVTKSDSGLYVCNINNEYNEVQQAVYTSLVVVSAPRITLLPPTQTVQPGQSATVECIVNGDDIIDIVWRPYNRVPSSRMEIRGNKLIFHQIEVEDAGQYECIARSQYANRTAIAEVIVSENSDRTVVSHDNEQWAHAGAAVHLSCNAVQPNTRVVWTKDGRPLPRSITRKKDGSLFIRLAHKSDTGRYVCSIRDIYGRAITSNYINLHIQGYECLETEFRCYDYSGCIDENLLCDGHKNCQDNSDEENCMWRDKRFSDTLQESQRYDGPRDPESQQLLRIEQPRRAFRVGDNVDVLCRIKSRDVKVQWQRLGTNQYVDYKIYGDGAMLSILGVTFADAGVYRCTGIDSQGRSFYDDFNLVVDTGSTGPNYADGHNIHVAEYTARLRDHVILPCYHDLETPVNIEWRREFLPLSAELRSNQPNLHLMSVTEADAGTYVCRVSNSRTAVEAMAILTVKGVVPRFEGESFIALPTLKDAFRQFEIEISFKPTEENGIILYNSQNQGREGDYIALQLKNGVPEFLMDTGTEPIKKVTYDRPLQLNTWHTIRLSRTNSKVTMDVDNTGPFIAESPEQWAVLDLKEPLYIGGVPDYDQLPAELAGASGFIGCVSMLILGKDETNIMMDSFKQYRISECNSCAPNLCLNNGFCQEARNERGYMCICASGFAGLNCDRTGEACRPGLCGPGKCSDTETGYKCACPVTHTGRNCEVKQSIEYPAFTGSAYLAIKPPGSSRTLKMSMNIKAATPVTDGIIMYCAESPRGYGGFTSLAVHDGRLEFRYDLGRGSQPVVLVSNKTLPANEWTNVHIVRVGSVVSLKINSVHSYEQRLTSPDNQRDLPLDTPIFVGGVDESITLNNNTGVTGGFNGCIKDFTMHGRAVDIVNQTIQSANVQECVSTLDPRGDIPEGENIVCQCRNGGQCVSPADPTTCSCPYGFTGQFCEHRAPSTMREGRPIDPCVLRPCRNGGTCRPDLSTRMNHTCDCPLGFAGVYCQMPLELGQSVGFNGNGYLELPASQLRYDQLDIDPAVIALAIHTTSDGVLLYQKETQTRPDRGDYILLRIERGVVVLDWDLGGGRSSISIGEVHVNDGERHQIIVRLMMDGRVELTVDTHQNIGTSNGIANVMNADSNIYIGGIPDSFNQQAFPGFTGCIEQVELMTSKRGLDLGQIAVTGRNTQRCKERRNY